MDLGNTLHVVLLLLLALVSYLVRMSSKTLTTRIESLEKLLDEVRKDLDQTNGVDV